mmetsp:Transcript_78429/g.205834  ORF Transcript_78429/g.205834 Transcript_78429/m.205834 type:complete len:147 (+) Transcript_78429:83-523(+)
MAPSRNSRSRALALALAACASAAGLSFALAGAAARPAAPTSLAARAAAAPVDGGNLGGDFWPHPWAEELGKSSKGDDMTYEDVVEHFNKCREAEGLDPLQDMSSPLIILEGVVSNSEFSGQKGMNKAQKIADGIQGSSFLLSELTS